MKYSHSPNQPILARKTVGIIIALLFMCTVLACTPKTSQKTATTRHPADSVRIASLAPASTKTLARLGLTSALIAVDSWSAQTPNLPASTEIFDMMHPDAERLAILEPDILFVSSMTKAGTSIDPFSPLAATGIKVVYIETAESLAQVMEGILLMAQLTGKEKEGDALIAEMENSFSNVAGIVATIPLTERRTVYFEIGPAPDLYSFGSGVYLDELLSLAGAKNILSGLTGWVALGAEAVAEADPDVILTNVNFIQDPVAEITARAGWAHFSAVRSNRVYLINPDTSSQAAPGLERALQEIARAVYPEYFPPLD